MCRGLLCLAGFLIAIIPPTAGGLCAQGPMAAQGSVAKLEFEVASVKQDKSDLDANGTFPLGPGNVFTPSGGSFSFTNFPLINYIAFAYKMNPLRDGANVTSTELRSSDFRRRALIEAIHIECQINLQISEAPQ
jgi:hypothetical protein